MNFASTLIVATGLVSFLVPATATGHAVQRPVIDYSLFGWWSVGLGTALLVLFVVVALVLDSPKEWIKRWLFGAIIVVSLGATLGLIASTVAGNLNSVTGGPVHWHADFVIDHCGTEVDLLDPTGLTNRIGTPVLHEHNDNRIHVEGVVQELQDVFLERFFDVIGGSFSPGFLLLPTEDGLVQLRDGGLCPGGQPATLQVFAFRTEGRVITEKKLDREIAPKFVLAPHPTVPPGDCLVFQLSDRVLDQADAVCDFIRIAADQGEYELVRSSNGR